MQKVPLDLELHSTLPTLTDAVLIVNEKGRIVGSFTPICLMEPPISDEELRRRANAKEKGITTAELLARLEAS